MGNSASNEGDEQHGNNHHHENDGSLDQFDGIETLGYRVLGVQPNSPASQAGLVSFFDFLVGANGQMLLGSGEGLEEGDEYDDVDFPALLEEFKGKPLELLVWNIKCQKERLVEIIPRDDWDGAGLLGVTIRLDNYAGAEERLIRILDVEHNSPAAVAGLISSKDYLLGTTTHSFDSTQILAAILDSNVDRVVELYVYNTTSDKVRVVALMPTWSWGGKGLLGAEVGTGYLHRLPSSCRDTLGGSVERKVRWVTAGGAAASSDAANANYRAAAGTPAGTSQEEAASQEQPPTQQPNGESQQQPPPQEPQQKSQEAQQVTVEMEPQLEMEPQEGEEEVGPSGNLQSVSAVSAAVPVSEKSQENQQQQQQDNETTQSAGASASETATSSISSSQQPTDVNQPKETAAVEPPPPQPTTTTAAISSAPTSGNNVMATTTTTTVTSAPTSGNHTPTPKKNMAEAVFSCASPAEAYFTNAEAAVQEQPAESSSAPPPPPPPPPPPAAAAAFPGPPLVASPTNNNPIPAKTIAQVDANLAPIPPHVENNNTNDGNSNGVAKEEIVSSFVPPPPKMSFT